MECSRGAPAGREQRHGSESGSQHSERRQRRTGPGEAGSSRRGGKKIPLVLNILVGGGQEGVSWSASPENRH